MNYIKEFGDENYNVPQFILDDLEWQDQSWHNDVCPRFENERLKLAVWVDASDQELREYDDWKRLTVAGLIVHENDSNELADDALFSTEDETTLLRWLQLHEILVSVEAAIELLNQLTVPCEDLADSLATAFEAVSQQMSILK